MSGGALRTISRIVFFLCGVTSLFTGFPYVMLQGVDMPVHRAWFLFPVALGVVGVFSVTVALLPRSWIAKACKRDRDDKQLFLAPLKLLGVFAAISYLLALLAYFAPHSWDLSPTLMLSLCPTYFVKLTFDPELVTVFFMLAPMNAGAFGALGSDVGVRVVWPAVGERQVRLPGASAWWRAGLWNSVAPETQRVLRPLRTLQEQRVSVT